MKTTAEIITNLKTDCIHYRGDRPCEPHTRKGATCQCDEYLPILHQGVIVKLGAAGDVLRTTPLLRAVKTRLPQTRLLFVTHSPELIPPAAAEAVRPTALVLERLRTASWDFCWNLDKDIDACVIADAVNAKSKSGFGLRDGVPFPLNEAAWHKFATGVDDPYSKANTLSYVREIFDIVELPFAGEEYWLKPPSAEDIKTAESLFPRHDWIGLNTGAGFRWPTRLWPSEYWQTLIGILQKKGLKPLILGGPEEKELNELLSLETGCPSSGLQTLGVFNAIIHRCQLVVTSVTQAMHLAIAAQKRLVLFNNIFNRHEFEMYGRGKIIGPEKACDCFYSPKCRTGRNCMTEISPETVSKTILGLLKHDT
jgi:heptosyltransferase-2